MLIRACVAALCLFASGPVATEPARPAQIVLTASAAELAKFPKSDPKIINGLAGLNKFVNGAMTYVSDQEHYGVADHYVSLPPDGKGDCEDYALSKMELLQRAGFPVVAYARMRGVMVGIQGHAILEILLPSGEHAFLDNMEGELMTRAELEKRGYKFFDW